MIIAKPRGKKNHFSQVVSISVLLVAFVLYSSQTCHTKFPRGNMTYNSLLLKKVVLPIMQVYVLDMHTHEYYVTSICNYTSICGVCDLHFKKCCNAKTCPPH